MQIVFHLGAHCTDDDRLLKSLLQNSGKLVDEGVVVPGPSRYRGLIEKAVQKLRGEPGSAEIQDAIFESLLDQDNVTRVVLSFENFICIASRVFDHGLFYERAAYKPAWLRMLFDGHEVEFALGLRNPATLIPALLTHPRQSHPTLADFLQGTDPGAARWTDVIAAIQGANPGIPLTAWANEDTPLIWPEVMREVAGLDPAVRLKGGLNIAAPLMRPEGMKRLRGYLGTHPPKNEIQRRRILAAFLDKYAIADEIEQEIDLPGWDNALVETMTEQYEDDLIAIARMPGVNFLAP